MKVILYMAISANGLIAKEDNNVDFVSNESWSHYQEIIKKTGNAIVGRRTYELMPTSEFLDDCLYVVLTRNQSQGSSRPNVVFSRNPTEALELLRDKGFKEACVVGGGKLNTSFMKEGLIDEIYLDIEPVIFGKGIQLFFPDDFEYQLKLLGVKKLNPHTVQLHYEIIK